MHSPENSRGGYFPRIRNAGALRRLNRFLASPFYILLLTVAALAGHALAAEVAVYWLFVAIAVYTLLLGDDLLPLMPLVVLCYVLPSPKNNPGLNTQSLFSLDNSGSALIAMAIVLIAALIVRIVADWNGFGKPLFTAKRSLWLGLLLLSAAYLLSGIGYSQYEALFTQNLLFAFVQICAIALPYFLFSGGVKWEKAPKDYLAWTGFCVGCLLLAEILLVYASGTVVVDGVILRKKIFTGWGMYNNMGGMLAMMIPFVFYLASRFNKQWLGIVGGAVFLVGVLLTCSRSSIIVGSGIYLLCVVLMLSFSHNRKSNAIALGTILGFGLIGILLFRQSLQSLFEDILNRGLNLNSRDMIFRNGWQMFKEHPVLGSTFYPPDNMSYSWSTNTGFTSFFPARWHNTIIQLLASCGLVGLVAYLFHRVQTVVLLIRNRSRESVFIACSVLVLLITSMFDCHMFNVGPVLFYSMALAFVEYRSAKE